MILRKVWCQGLGTWLRTGNITLPKCEQGGFVIRTPPCGAPSPTQGHSHTQVPPTTLWPHLSLVSKSCAQRHRPRDVFDSQPALPGGDRLGSISPFCGVNAPTMPGCLAPLSIHTPLGTPPLCFSTQARAWHIVGTWEMYEEGREGGREETDTSTA